MPGARIVVVDDDEDIRFALREALEMEGYSVLLAASGFEAIEIVDALGSESVVLLDMCMPAMSGEEVLQHFRAQGLLSTLAVIVLTATRPDFATVAGARLCLSKPIELDVLLRVLERLCIEPHGESDTSETRIRTRVAPSLAKCTDQEGPQLEQRVRRISRR